MANDTIKIKAIIIRSADSGENNRILTLLSHELGKISVIAKGARSLKHKSQGATNVLCYCDFILKPIKDNLYSLTSAELIEGFRSISESIELLSYAAYFMGLCEMGVQSGINANEEVRLLLNTLYVLSKRPESGALIKAVYELKLAEIFGFMPEFSSCCPCGKDATHFCIQDSEMRCREHKSEDCIYLTARQIKILETICESSVKDALFLTCSNEDSSSLSSVIEPFLHYHLGNLPKSLEFLHKNL